MLLDQRLPGAADLALLRTLRERGDATPVVILTGHKSVEAAIGALTLGVVDYLVKPAHIERILAAVRLAARAGACHAPIEVPSVAGHGAVSVSLLPVLFNASRADEVQLRTQLAWAVADEQLSFPERIAAPGDVSAMK